VKKSRSEAIWLRFRAACDAVFTRDSQRRTAATVERLAAREAACQDLERLVSSTSEAPPTELLAAMRSAESRWQKEPPVFGSERERMAALEQRYVSAWNALVTRWRSVVTGTDLDPDGRRRKLEELCRRVEGLASGGSHTGAAEDASLSPAERLALRLKETLASNTIGGKIDEGSRWRAAAEDTRQAQAAWARVGFVPEEIRRPLAERFDRACRYIAQKAGGGRPGGPRPGAPRFGGRTGREEGPGKSAT
jgi:hypothetical protein